MSASFSKLLNLFKSVLLRVKSIDQLRRWIKWILAVTILAIWYKKYKVRPHDNIPMMPDCSPIFGHFLVIHKNFDNATYYVCS